MTRGVEEGWLDLFYQFPCQNVFQGFILHAIDNCHVVLEKVFYSTVKGQPLAIETE